MWFWQLPKYVQRRRIRLCIIYAASLIALLPILVVASPGPRSGDVIERVILWSPLLLVLVISVGVISVGELRLRKRARRSAFHLCERCLYDLSTAEPAGTCPECGVEYTHGAIAERWKSMYVFRSRL